MNRWLMTSNREGSVRFGDVPRLSYLELYDDVCRCLRDDANHCAAYFGVETDGELLFICIMLNDAAGVVYVASCVHDELGPETILPSLTAVHPAMHVFEREITENFGLIFEGNPWNKPLRYAHDRMAKGETIQNYPFYSVQGDALHEVNVGPIHAGIIEPGVFRFICNGEQVLHLEIVLGYQHRGVERMMRETSNRLRQLVLAESIAGDSAVAHGCAYAGVIEKLSPSACRETLAETALDEERAVALELERIAMHLADTGALCMDIGFQLGQVACEALRTLVINSTQLWCGNRFGKGLIRPLGSYYPMTLEVRGAILKNLKEVEQRYAEVAHGLAVSPSVLARFEDCGIVTRGQSLRSGAVGMAARASGNVRDIRQTHPWGVYATRIEHSPVSFAAGDVMARLRVRVEEVQQSITYIRTLLDYEGTELVSGGVSQTVLGDDSQPVSGTNIRSAVGIPDYESVLTSDSLAFSLVEGWRGEICHVGITDREGQLVFYKIQDPSLHNWMSLALSVRGAGISDFPICNKSFNLSYCGHDL